MKYDNISKYELMSTDISKYEYHLSENHNPNFEYAQKVICGAIIPRRRTWSHLRYTNAKSFVEDFRTNLGYTLCPFCETKAFGNQASVDEDGEWFELQ